MSHVTTIRLPMTCFAVAGPGLEPLLADELRELQPRYPLELDAPEPGGVVFRAGAAGLYATNLHLRIASRVLVRIGAFHASAFHELERNAARLPWEELVREGQPVTFRVTSRKSRLYHQDAVAERLHAAVGSRVRRAGSAMTGSAMTGSAMTGSAMAAGNEAQEFFVRLVRDECVVSVDASGELLHRRGYRLATAKAPLRETLAAAMLAGAGWDGSAPLMDPMCGSGTIPIEAAMLARRIPPGLNRGFAFQRWPVFDEAAWRSVLAAARERILPAAPARIHGSDRDAGAVRAAAANAVRAGVGGDVEWRRAAISAIEPPGEPGWVVTNPPYGVRVGERKRLRDLYAQFGNVMRAKCAGWEVALLTSHPELEHQTGLPLTPRLGTENGGLRVRLMRARVP